jgi:hypothetical protein
MQPAFQDHFGLGWRRELATGILANLDRIDLVEVIADDFFDAPRTERRALRTLAAQAPVVLHGVSLGLASPVPVELKRLEKMARLCDEIQPQAWSEHLAFVRGGGIEIGHLTAPPRTQATIEGAAANLDRARSVVGSQPQVENIATLIEPPGSDRDEIAWLSDILDASECPLLLDLHNLYANSVNFGFDPVEALSRLPMERVAAVHLAGGRWIGAPNAERLLDDHLHDVPDPIFALLSEAGARAPQPLTVILERDGRFPPVESLLAELDRARGALALGRARAGSHASSGRLDTPQYASTSNMQPHAGSDAFPGFLAKIYVDANARARFLADPRGEAIRAGLSEAEIAALETIDRTGLELAADSLRRKRDKRFRRIFQR